MKRFIVWKLCFDFIAIFVALVSAYVVKFKIPQLSLYFLNFQYGDIQHHAQFEPYLASLWVILTISLIFLLIFDAYRPTVSILPEIDHIIKLIKVMTFVVVTIIIIQFFLPVIPGSRMVVVYFWVFSIILLAIGRLIILNVETHLYKKGVGARRSLIIGASMLSQDVAERMVMYPAMGYYYVGFLDDVAPDNIHFHLRDRFKLLGTVDQFSTICEQERIDAIFLIKRDIERVKYRELTQFSIKHNIQLNVLSEPILDTPFIEVGVFDGVSMISTMNLKRRWIERYLKRLFDIIVSLVALITLSPIFLLIALWIKLVSPGAPILFKQVRVGQFSKEFNMIKFRSMIPDAEKLTGPVMVDDTGDQRYIRGGQFLRQFSLDELPQLWNVFIGQMSIVGPRPERPHFVTEFSKFLPYFNERHVVPVGITGWAQVNGRSVLTHRPEHKVKYDIYYINHWSFLFDIKICLKTFFIVFFSRGILLVSLIIFGGAFDPFHNGHLEIVHYLSQLDYCDRLCLVPTGQPVFKDQLRFSSAQRFEMLTMMFHHHANVDISDYELRKREPSFTIDTVRFLLSQYDELSCALVIGYDQFLNFHRWRQYQDIFNHCRLMVIPRQGLDFNDSLKTIPKVLQSFEKSIEFLYLLPADVSSSQIRTLLDEDASIEFLVPDKILSLIKRYEVR